MRKSELSATAPETTVRRGGLKELARQVIDRQPVVGHVAIRRAIERAATAAGLSDFREGLLLGNLMVCANCAAFRFAPDPTAIGHCMRFDSASAPLVPFFCSSYVTSDTPASPEYVPDRAGILARARATREGQERSA